MKSGEPWDTFLGKVKQTNGNVPGSLYGISMRICLEWRLRELRAIDSEGFASEEFSICKKILAIYERYA